MLNFIFEIVSARCPQGSKETEGQYISTIVVHTWAKITLIVF